jgi:IS30 family transposase
VLGSGSEFEAHAKINKRHSIEVFFAKKYAGWQRGTNENTNGDSEESGLKNLICRFFLKRK